MPLIVVTLLLTLHSVAESRDPDAVKGFDIPGVVLSALGLGGPVFAPDRAADAMAGATRWCWSRCSPASPASPGSSFARRRPERRCCPLSLFRVRNFAVANAATLTIYAGLMGSSFFLTLYLQQVAGYTALAAGFAGVPISLMLFFLSPRFGAFTARVGPRLPMSAGPIVGGVGLLLLLRVGVNPSYPTEVLPALIVFGLGLSATWRR